MLVGFLAFLATLWFDHSPTSALLMIAIFGFRVEGDVRVAEVRHPSVGRRVGLAFAKFASTSKKSCS